MEHYVDLVCNYNYSGALPVELQCSRKLSISGEKYVTLHYIRVMTQEYCTNCTE